MKTRKLFLVVSIATFFSCAANAQSDSEVATMKAQLSSVAKTHGLEKGNLENFDDLDFNV